MVWIDAQKIEHIISEMPTDYLENCISLIDELLPQIIKRRDNGIHAQNELTLKRDQKKEMLRVLESRRLSRVSPITAYSCMNCNHSHRVVLTFGRGAELICNKLGMTCQMVNFSCGAWEKANGKES